MSLIDAEDIAASKDCKKQLLEHLSEWSSLITELTDKERKLYDCKEDYQVLSDKIIAETDFKEIYGKNNADVRKRHIQNALPEHYGRIKELEFRIDYINRRIPYLKELIRTKRAIMELKE